MTYQQCLDWLFSQLPMYQRTGSIAYKSDMGIIVQATEKLANPHQDFKSIHIAGTNGKGSTCHLLASSDMTPHGLHYIKEKYGSKTPQNGKLI